MQELEKILEEIQASSVYAEVADGYGAMCVTVGTIERIIRKHMTDGWIPVEERMPEVPDDMEDEYCPEFNVTIKGASRATTLKYSPDGAWFDDSGQVYVVIAWRPLPDLYRSEKGAEIETKQNGARKED